MSWGTYQNATGPSYAAGCVPPGQKPITTEPWNGSR